MQHVSQGIEDLRKQLEMPSTTEQDPIERECEACGAEPAEDCRPLCLGKALQDDIDAETD